MNPRVILAAQEAGLPFAPGIATPSDLEAAIELGCRFVKFFPAEASGGIQYLRSMSAPLQTFGHSIFSAGWSECGEHVGVSEGTQRSGHWRLLDRQRENW